MELRCILDGYDLLTFARLLVLGVNSDLCPAIQIPLYGMGIPKRHKVNVVLANLAICIHTGKSSRHKRVVQE